MSFSRQEDEEEAWDEEVTRASGDCLCPSCGKPYWKHHQPLPQGCPTVVRACDGKLLKL